MAYTNIGAKAVADPGEAKALLRAAFKRARGDAVKAAKALGVTRRTFDRIVARLGLDEEIAELRRRAREAARRAA